MVLRFDKQDVSPQVILSCHGMASHDVQYDHKRQPVVDDFLQKVNLFGPGRYLTFVSSFPVHRINRYHYRTTDIVVSNFIFCNILDFVNPCDF